MWRTIIRILSKLQKYWTIGSQKDFHAIVNVVHEQNVFSKCKSTANNLSLYQHYIINAFQSRNKVMLIIQIQLKPLIVNRDLAGKLNAVGINCNLLTCIRNFLNERIKYDIFGNFISSPLIASQGYLRDPIMGKNCLIYFLMMQSVVSLTAGSLMIYKCLKWLKIQTKQNHNKQV